MATFSDLSQQRLATCDERLQRIMNQAILSYDFSVLEGYRDEAEQNAAVADGRSKVNWPNGKHNQNPSLAVDIAPNGDKTAVGW